MGNNNHFNGINKVCAQCIKKCKQFENVTLVNCPVFKSVRTDNPLSSRRGKRSRIQKETVRNGK
jgi:hypothetical protein